MSDPTFAIKDPATIEASVLARYKASTGITLAPGDPRRLHLQTLIYELVLLRSAINFAGRQNLLRYVSDEYIDNLGALWREPRLEAKPSECTQRFHTSALPGATYTVAEGKRVTDGAGNTWAVVTTTVSGFGDATIDVLVRCTVNGANTNGVAAGQIDTLVDPIPGIVSTENTEQTRSGRDIESTEAYRTRLLSQPDGYATAGPRAAYEVLARSASSSVEDVVVLGPDDAYDLGGLSISPGNVLVLVTEVDADEPSTGLLAAVEEKLSADEVRPLCDHVRVEAPSFVTYGISATYYIGKSRASSVAEIQTAVTTAVAAYTKWQRKIGRDINPDELKTRIVNAGAKRVVIGFPAFTPLSRNQCARQLPGSTVAYGGIEND